MKVFARSLVSYQSEAELCNYLQTHFHQTPTLPMLHIGGGSNLLFLGDYEGVILYSQIHDICVVEEREDEVLVRVGAGVVHDNFVRYAVSHGWYGLENLTLIPGQVGASAVQNIGAYGAEVCDVIDTVRGISLTDGTPCQWSAVECQYAYRQSVFKQSLRGQYAITYVTYRLRRTFQPHLDYGGLRAEVQRVCSEEELTAEKLCDIIADIRRRKLPDPAEQGNAGSFFMNPVVDMSLYCQLREAYPSIPSYPVDDTHVKVPAGWLIEQAGWKGRALGPAAVHDKQALVLVNQGGATGQDIAHLSDAVRQAVRERFHIELKPEVNFIG